MGKGKSEASERTAVCCQYGITQGILYQITILHSSYHESLLIFSVFSIYFFKNAVNGNTELSLFWMYLLYNILAA